MNDTPVIGQRYTEADDYLKWAVYGQENTGKTHFGISAARMREHKRVIIFNLEPKSNLIAVLNRFPDIADRTTVLPTDEDLEKISEEALSMDPSIYVNAFDFALANYVIDKVIDLTYNHRDVVKGTLFIMDTASQVYRKLMDNIIDARKHDERIRKMAQLAYSEPKRKFQAMIRMMAMWPTDVIWLGRTRPAGEEVVDPVTGKRGWRQIPGKEEPEWKGMVNYEATVIIYLTKKRENILDDNRSYVLDEYGNPLTQEVRYAQIVKHKSGRSGIPTIRDPTPAKIVAWLRGLTD